MRKTQDYGMPEACNSNTEVFNPELVHLNKNLVCHSDKKTWKNEELDIFLKLLREIMDLNYDQIQRRLM